MSYSKLIIIDNIVIIDSLYTFKTDPSIVFIKLYMPIAKRKNI